MRHDELWQFSQRANAVLVIWLAGLPELLPFCFIFAEPCVMLPANKMASALTEPRFTVWGIDQAPYGPIELPTLVSWVKDERVTADTWIFVGQDGSWRRAADLAELQFRIVFW
jgi:hypothetical protein